MIASFSLALTAHVTQWSNYLTQRVEILSRRSNLTPQRARNTVNDLSVPVCGTEVAFDIKQAKAGWLHSFLSFLPETFTRNGSNFA